MMFNSPVGQISLHYANSQVRFHQNVLNFDMCQYMLGLHNVVKKTDIAIFCLSAI